MSLKQQLNDGLQKLVDVLAGTPGSTAHVARPLVADDDVSEVPMIPAAQYDLAVMRLRSEGLM